MLKYQTLGFVFSGAGIFLLAAANILGLTFSLGRVQGLLLGCTIMALSAVGLVFFWIARKSETPTS